MDIEQIAQEVDEAMPGFEIQPVAQFATDKPLRWIIKGVLPDADLGVIYGEPGCGKSFLALDMAAAIALGNSWQGNRTRKGRVVFVAAEGSAGLRRRFQAYAMAHKVDLAALDVHVVPQSIDLLAKKDPTILGCDLVAKLGSVDLVIIDTLAASMPGGDENSSGDMGSVLRNLKEFSVYTGAMVLLVHHAGKDATRGARGWSGLKAACDTEICVERNGDARTAKVSKLKDGDDGACYGFNLKSIPLGYDDDGDPISSCYVEFTSHGEVKAPRKPPSGQWSKAAYNAANGLLDRSSLVTVDEITNAVMDNTVATGDRDRRPELIRRAINTLITQGYFQLRDEYHIRIPQKSTCGINAEIVDSPSFSTKSIHNSPPYRGEVWKCGNGSNHPQNAFSGKDVVSKSHTGDMPDETDHGADFDAPKL